jgi:TP901 family phage tail tape measure protein
MGAFVIPSVFTAVNKVSAVVLAMQKDVKTFAFTAQNAATGQQAYFSRLSSSMADAKRQLLSFASTAVIVAAIVAALSFSAKAVTDYETEIQNLSALTGASGEALNKFKGNIKDVANATQTSAVDVAAAFAAIANNQPALLKDADALSAVTKSSILLAQGARMELAPAGEAVTTILNQYGNGAEYAAKMVDILAAGSKAGSSEIRDTTEAIQKFGPVAAAAGVKIKESVALIQLAAPFEKGAEAGSKLRNILISMGAAKVLDKAALKDLRRLHVDLGIVTNKALPLKDRLIEMSKVAGDTNAIFHIFGKENQAMAQGILSNAGAFAKMLDDVSENGVAAQMAAKNTDTLVKVWGQLKDKFITWLVTSDEATKSLDLLKTGLRFVKDNLYDIIKVTGLVVGLFLAYKLGVMAAAAWTAVYNVALGIQAALQGESAFALAANTLAMGAYRAALVVATGAQAALNYVMALNPVALVVLAVLALVAALGYVISNYKTIAELHADELTKKKTRAIDDETRAVRAAAKSYEKYGYSVEEAQKKAIMDERVTLKNEAGRLKTQHEVATEVGYDSGRRVAEQGMAVLEGKLTALNNPSIFTQPDAEAPSPAIDLKAKQQEAMMMMMQTTQNANVNIKINDPNNRTNANSDDSFVKILTTSTMSGN